MQHPSEMGHGKNSAQLLPLILPKAEIFVGETEADFALMRARLADEGLKPLLVYPTNEGRQEVPLVGTERCDLSVLLLLDGTWRKALKMYRLNPWLGELPHLSLKPDQRSAYLIRKSSRTDSLSTLEAAAAGLALVEPSLDIAPLHRAFAAMVRHRIEAMPAPIRRRYGA